MTTNWDRWILDRLFIAIPELGADKRFVDRLLEQGAISQTQYRIFRRVAGQHRPDHIPRGKSLLERLMLTAPEILSAKTVTILDSMGLITNKQAHALRVLLRAAGRLLPGAVKDDQIMARLVLIFDDVFSSETVAFIRALDNEQIEALRDLMRRFPENFGLREQIFGHRTGTLTSGDAALIRAMLERSIRRAQVIRSVISTGHMLRGTVSDARKLDNVWDVLTLAFDDLFSDRLLRNLVRAGVISPERYALAKSLQDLGAGVWRKVAAARDVRPWLARSLLLSEGVISPETIRVLVALGRLTPTQAKLLYPVANAIREITRGIGDRWRTSRRYRIVAGEPPIKTFARFTSQTDKRILGLLSDAAKDASKEAKALASTKEFGKLTRAAQQRLVANRLHVSMRQLWEDVGSLIIFGEKEAAQAALEAMTFLERPYGSQAGELQRMLRHTAQSGVDSYISREENLLPLSRRVYRNLNLAQGHIDREIAKALLRGLSPAELAQNISQFIRPGVPGGTSYAAMRLARTEINNAFHFTSIRYTREMPWVDGYKWQLSGSHPRVDVCNDYAEDNHDGIGRGVFSKGTVPGKPHPQCLCYTTTVTADTATWYKRYRSGAYDPYIDNIQGSGVFEEDGYTPLTNEQVVRGQGAALVLDLLAQTARRAAAFLRAE